MAKRKIRLHAGDTLRDVMKERNMTVEYLAIRTGSSVAYINQVLNGIKPITDGFANHLQYSLNIDASFWINLQHQYDSELL